MILLASTRNHAMIKKLIDHLNLQPHPEGGLYARAFQSSLQVKALDTDRYHNEPRSAGTSTYYLLQGEEFSAWHILASDETWHYYKGSPVRIYMIAPNGHLESHILADLTIYDGGLFQITIPAHHWFAAELIDKNTYGLVGCTVNPGFEFKDFKLGDETSLLAIYPQHAKIIRKFLP